MWQRACYLLGWTALAAWFDAYRLSEDDLDGSAAAAAAAAAAGWSRFVFAWASCGPCWHRLISLTRSGLAAAAALDAGGWWTLVWTECFTEGFTVVLVVVVMVLVEVVEGLAWWRGRWGGAVVARKARTYRTQSTQWWIRPPSLYPIYAQHIAGPLLA